MKLIKKIATLSLLLAASVSARAITVTFHVDDADAVNMNFNGSNSVLAVGDNTFNFNQYDYVTLSGVTPWIITGVTNSSGTPESVYSGSWYKSIYESDEGQVYTIATRNLDAGRTASCTVNVDDPSLVSAVLMGTYTPVTLNDGVNTLKFDPESEGTLMISPAVYNKPLYKVSLDGQELTSQGGSYYATLTQGCVIDIEARIPAVPVTVTFTYSEKGEGALSSVAVDNQTVTDFDGKTLSMIAGQSLTLNPNSAYNITGMSINGETQYWSGGYAYTIGSVIGDTEVYIDAHPYSTISVTLNVSNPEQIKVYRGYSYNNDLLTLTENSNTIELPENNTILSWAAADGCFIESVKVNGDPYTYDYLSCTDGMIVEIVTEAIVMDRTAAVWIDDRSLADQYFSFESNTREQYGNRLESGYNLIEFSGNYSPFMLSWYTQNQIVGKIYINDELRTPLYEGSTSYELPLVNNDVVKIFYANEPVECNVTFNVTPGIEPNVIRDVICAVTDVASPLKCFAGTQIDITKGEQAFDVKINGEKIDPLPDSDDYRFTIVDPETSIDIVEKSQSGIGSIAGDTTDNAPVYNLQGVKVGNTLRNLPAGIYITAGRKVIVK